MDDLDVLRVMSDNLAVFRDDEHTGRVELTFGLDYDHGVLRGADYDAKYTRKKIRPVKRTA